MERDVKVIFAIVFIIFGLLIVASVAGFIVYGQENLLNEAVHEEVQETTAATVQSTTFPIDATLLTTIAGSVGGLLWKDRRDKKDVENQLKEAIDVLMVLNASYIKFFNASMIYPEKNVKQILQLKSANNALEDQTLAAEMANGIQRYQKYAVGNFHLQAPNMTTPSPQVINATTVVPENKVEASAAVTADTNTVTTTETSTEQTTTN